MLEQQKENMLEKKITELSSGTLKLRDVSHIKMYRDEEGMLTV